MHRPLPRFIAVGASGGDGLEDILTLLGGLTPSLDAIVMVVLHRPSDRSSNLRSVLARRANMPVVIASQAERMRTGVCYVGEPDGHLTLVGTHVAHLVTGDNHILRNQNIDLLFNSLAQNAGRRTVGVVLSGALRDGSRGLAAIHKAGGLTMVLNPGGQPHGMQQNSIDHAGPIDLVGTTVDIADRVNRTVAGAGAVHQTQRRSVPTPA